MNDLLSLFLCLLLPVALSQTINADVPSTCIVNSVSNGCYLTDLVNGTIGPSTTLTLTAAAPNVGVQITGGDALTVYSLTLQAKGGASLTFFAFSGINAKFLSLHSGTVLMTWSSEPSNQPCSFTYAALYTGGVLNVWDGTAAVSGQFVSEVGSTVSVNQGAVFRVGGAVVNISGIVQGAGEVWVDPSTLNLSPYAKIGTVLNFVQGGGIQVVGGNLTLSAGVVFNFKGFVASAPCEACYLLLRGGLTISSQAVVAAQGIVYVDGQSVNAGSLSLLPSAEVQVYSGANYSSTNGSSVLIGDRAQLSFTGSPSKVGGSFVLGSYSALFLNDKIALPSVSVAGTNSSIHVGSDNVTFQTLMVQPRAVLAICGYGNITIASSFQIQGVGVGAGGISNILFNGEGCWPHW